MPSKRMLSVIILAGGHSRRFGHDKALLPWRGRTLIQDLVARLQELSDDVLVVSGTEIRYTEILDVPVYPDEIGNLGPMGGLYTGLKHARYAYSLAVACDMPCISHAVIDLLRDHLDGSAWAVVPEIEGHRVPTLALYHKKCLPVIAHLITHKHTSLQALLDAVPTKIISEEQLRIVDPELRSFTNINTLDDWKRCVQICYHQESL